MRDKNISGFVAGQLSKWKLASDNFKALDDVCVREVEVNGLTVKLQFNPARMISSAAKLSKEEIARRRCFLCEENRPPEQDFIPFESHTGHRFHILVNPYPIFDNHLVIAVEGHHDQSIAGRYEDMLQLAREYEDCTFFYNGPCCGASAPDHHHFQAAPRGIMPLETSVDAYLAEQDVRLTELCSRAGATLYKYNAFATGIFVITSDSPESMSGMFYRLLDCAEMPDGDIEPRINLYTWFTGKEYRTVVFFRKCHRSHHYFSEGPDHLTMSPGCADMAGVFIVPVEEEYYRIAPEILLEMIGEITIPEDEERRIISRMTRTQPLLNVGIMAADEIEFEIFEDGLGVRKAVLSDGRIGYDGKLYDELYFEALESRSMFAHPSFSLHGVTIGVDFHWERKESQKFAGALKIIVDGDLLRAINVVGVEDYLLSVISSEMRATASEEFLKAHAVISRSWVMARISASRGAGPDCEPVLNETQVEQDIYEYVKWYDHEDHTLFDVCADDHCQRYQGLTRATGETVRRVIDSTWGEVLKYDDQLCDARFSKCCGGRMERFSTCWEDKDYPYLQPLADAPGHDESSECFCNTSDREVLSQVLNDYDLETQDFYRWTREYDPVELGILIEKKSGIHIGKVIGIQPLERGDSGRIFKLKIIGEDKTIIVGKELEIRRILSESHLKSSAFEVEYMTGEHQLIRLNGCGWGHGVGLCQIGAAVMATRGYTYREILQHYYPGAILCR